MPEPIGEAWLTARDCKIADGVLQGKTLGAAWKEMPAEWRGSYTTRYKDFPLLLKLIFPKDKLSIQVHPDDSYASKHEQAAGGRGKTEMWHAVSAEPGSQVLIGLKSGVDKKKFCEALKNHRLEELFDTHPVQAGDTFFLPAGTPHTMGPGMIIFEVQEYSDLTYRVYDYARADANGKPRELHIEKALDVIRFDAPPFRPFRPSVPMDEIDSSLIYYLAVCRHFSAQKWEVKGHARFTIDAARFELLTVLTGNGVLQWGGQEQSFSPGETWFLPATLGECRLFPAGSEAKVIRSFVPEDVSAFDVMMAKRGYPENLRRQFIFPDAP